MLWATVLFIILLVLSQPKQVVRICSQTEFVIKREKIVFDKYLAVQVLYNPKLEPVARMSYSEFRNWLLYEQDDE